MRRNRRLRSHRNSAALILRETHIQYEQQHYGLPPGAGPRCFHEVSSLRRYSGSAASNSADTAELPLYERWLAS